MMNQSVSIIGSGSWATALVKIFTETGTTVHWYVRKQSTIDYVKQHRHNPNYIPAALLPLDKIELTTDLQTAMVASNYIILAVPAAFIHTTLLQLKNKDLWKGKIIFSAIKGVVPEYNLIVGEYLQRVFNVEQSAIGVITGPCHAEEVAMEKLSYLTVASENKGARALIAAGLRCDYMNVEETEDIYGTEYSGVLKNIMALASGICHGLGYGDNFQAVLISNAIQEIKRFVDAVHPINRDIKEHAYLGDLLVTAYSQFSRNRMFGSMIGKGYSVKSAQVEMNMIAEGYYASKCIYEINQKHKVDLPICDAVYAILYKNASVKETIQELTKKL